MNWGNKIKMNDITTHINCGILTLQCQVNGFPHHSKVAEQNVCFCFSALCVIWDSCLSSSVGDILHIHLSQDLGNLHMLQPCWPFHWIWQSSVILSLGTPRTQFHSLIPVSISLTRHDRFSMKRPEGMWNNGIDGFSIWNFRVEDPQNRSDLERDHHDEASG